MSPDFDPYYKWLGIPKDQRPPNYYQLLGLTPLEDDLDVVSNACDQRMAFIRTFQSGQNSAVSQKLLNEISEARGKLLNPVKKAAYDRELKTKMAAHADAEIPAAQIAAAPLPALPPTASTLKRATPMPPSRPTPQAQTTPQIQLAGTNSANERSFRSKRRQKRRWLVAAACLAVLLVGGIVVTVIAVRSKSDGTSTAATDGDDNKPDSPVPNVGPAVNPNKIDPVNPDIEPGENPSNPFEPVKPTPDPDPVVPTPDPNPQPNPDPGATPDPIPVPMPMPSPEPRPAPNSEPALPKLAAIPADSARQETMRLVREIYADNYANAKTPQDKLALANLLFDEAKKIKDDPVSHYVMLLEAREMAIAGGGRDVALQTIELLAAKFEVDALALKAETVLRLAEQRTTLEERTGLIETGLTMIDTAVAADRYDIGQDLAEMCGKSITSLRDVELRKKVQEKRKEFDAIRTQWATVKEAAATLEINPDDADANLAYGRYLCLTKGDWRRGLPMLAKSSDAELKTAAGKDLAGPETTDARKTLADDWLKLGSRDATSKNFQARAHSWYTAALKDAGGLAAIEIKKRIDETAAIAAAAPRIMEAPAAIAAASAVFATLRATLKGQTSLVRRVDFSPNSSLLASFGNDQTIHIWNTVDSTERTPLEGLKRIGDLKFAPDGRTLIVADDQMILFTDLATVKARRVPTQHNSEISSLALSRNGTLLLSASNDDETIFFWDTRTATGVRSFESTKGKVSQIAISPDQMKLAWSSRQRNSSLDAITLWDVAANTMTWSIGGHDNGSSSLTFSPDGKRLMSVGDGSVKFWDVADGTELLSFGGSRDTVYRAALSPDGGTVATGGRNGSLTLWDAQTGQQRQQIAAHVQSVTCLTFSSDGMLLATGSSDGSVTLWNLAPADGVAASTSATPVTVKPPVVPPEPPVKPPVPQDEAAALDALKQLGAQIGNSSAGLNVSVERRAIADNDLAPLKSITNLYGLTLANVSISSAGLSHLDGLTTLRTLQIYRTNVSDEGLRHLAGLSGLENLNLRESPITGEGLVHLRALGKLKSLTLPDSVAPKSMETLAGLASLEFVAPPTSLDDDALVYLEQLPNLHVLHLVDTQITDKGLSRLKNFTSIQRLTLPKAASGESLKHVVEMPKIEEVSIWDTQLLSGGLTHLSGGKHFRRLTVNGSQVVDDALADLDQVNVSSILFSGPTITNAGLHQLEKPMSLVSVTIINNPKVTDMGLVNLRGATQLTSLQFGSTGVTEQGVADLQKVLPQCRITK